MREDYSELSGLQKQQLFEQDYMDTSDICLGVWAPGHGPYLAQSLSRQLHRNFHLLEDIRCLPGVAGVVIAAEDVDCMSTTLMCLAQELRTGADFVYCDALYGPAGEIFCTAGPEGCFFGVASVALLGEVLSHAAADTPLELLRRCGAAARAPQKVEQALIQFRRDPLPGDLFASDSRHALLLTHEFSMTGAPIVLTRTIPVLRDLGYDVVVLGPVSGDALPLFVQVGAKVLIHSEQLNQTGLLSLALHCDLVLANTVVEAPMIRLLNGAAVPVLWWLHDAFACYPDYLIPAIPRDLGANIRLYAVGRHAAAAMERVRPEFQIHTLEYGLPDYAQDSVPSLDLRFAQDKLLFVTVGSLEKRKGPDILCRAIRALTPERLEKAAFLFVGQSLDSDLLEEVLGLVREYPDHVFYWTPIDRDGIKALMRQTFCLVCASRDDPMPTFVTEGLIFGRPAIVSEHTGTANLITNGVDGFVYRDDNPEELAHTLSDLIDHPDPVRGMEAPCRALYERVFSQQAFAEHFSDCVREVTAYWKKGVEQ